MKSLIKRHIVIMVISPESSVTPIYLHEMRKKKTLTIKA